MILTIFTHDFHLEIGHSNAMIELIRHSKLMGVQQIKIVSYTCSDPGRIFPNQYFNVKHIKVPLGFLYPSILRIVFFQLYTLIYSLLFKREDEYSVSIGVASLTSDIVNVQFVHNQWERQFFEVRKLPPLKYIYKKLLLKYLSACEKFSYLQKKYFIFLSGFVGSYCRSHFGLNQENSKVIYSGVNTERFSIDPTINEEQALNCLKTIHPVLEKIDINRPIFLFAGAHERKGLKKTFSLLKDLENPQIIVIGSSENGSYISSPPNVDCIQVEFTKNIDLFYLISDAFILPTIYEPFGLVLLEAAAMGLPIYTNFNNVGASELLYQMKEVYFLDKENSHSRLHKVSKLSLQERISLREARMPILKQHDWDNAGVLFDQILAQTTSLKKAA